MTKEAYRAIEALRRDFRALVEKWNDENPYLGALQERLRLDSGYVDYRVETPIVYNGALDDIGPGDRIAIVLVADNPGKKEQLAVNRRYLVGQSGKLAEGWLRRELGIDFRREVLILNKTPVHTPKTAELRTILALAGKDRKRLEALLAESQAAMADLALRACDALGATLWISGLGELRQGGLFESYRDALVRALAAEGGARHAGMRLAAGETPLGAARGARHAGMRLAAGETPLGAARGARHAGTWAFSHFSMNRFSIEVAAKARPGFPLAEELARIGTENWKRIFGG